MNAAGDPSEPHASGDAVPTRESGDPTRVGFVVSKAVGNAVVRHRVARRLRHVMRARLAVLPAGTLVVVRALPRAASATSDELAKDVDSALRKFGVGRERSDAEGRTSGQAAGERAAERQDTDRRTPRDDGSSTGFV